MNLNSNIIKIILINKSNIDKNNINKNNKN